MGAGVQASRAWSPLVEVNEEGRMQNEEMGSGRRGASVPTLAADSANRVRNAERGVRKRKMSKSKVGRCLEEFPGASLLLGMFLPPII